MKTTFFRNLLIGIALLSMAACAGSDSQVSLMLTDAPGDDVRAAVVTVDQIYLQGDVDGEEATDATDERTVLRDEPITVDLVDLSNSAKLLVDDHVVPAGTYSQLRFVISGAAVAVDRDEKLQVWATPGYTALPDGELVGELRIPSWSSSGFKVEVPGDAVELYDESRTFLVDFDVAESISTDTGSGDLVMRPVIEATDLELSSTLEVQVSLPTSYALVVSNTFAVLRDADGNFEGRIPLESDGGVGVATFHFLRPSEGPFLFSIDVVAAVDIELMTTPDLPLIIDLESGTSEAVELEVTGYVIL